jgi:hypothetical protein
MSFTFQKFMSPLILNSLFSFYIIYLSFSFILSLPFSLLIPLLLNPQMIKALNILFHVNR